MGTQLLIREQLSQDEVDNIYVENANETQEGSGQQEQIIESSVENEQGMEEFKKFNKHAYEWLSKIPPKHWSRSHFSCFAISDVLLNNMCEVFNGKIVAGRDKAIITLLECIRNYLMNRLVTVMQVINSNSDVLTPYATKLLKTSMKDATRQVYILNSKTIQDRI
ncbi:hypothetical protein QVD17_02016 [Tagetes erecta]|uniref:Uncharacterized protein n=1 Tax=Tagetes erecta TaxID=13708 RepID=A0AAD8L7F5_TARER|nr:hypothetical protein QVD17_02016 [Tagetes erecta]